MSQKFQLLPARRQLRPLLYATFVGAAAAIFIWILFLWLIPLPVFESTTPKTANAATLPVPLTGRHGLPVPEVPPPPIPMLYRVQTPDPVIFVTIDDGVFMPADAQQFIMERRLPITSFLTTSMVRRDPGYFAAMQPISEAIANHTVHHPHMTRLPYTGQKDEICDAQQQLKDWFGARPTLFRPPYGEFNLSTRRAAAYCGIKYLVTWSVVLEKGKLSYLSPTGQLEPGDIVLLHFRPELKHDLEQLLAAADARGLHVAPLPQYLSL